MTRLQTIRQNISNKYTVFQHLYTYGDFEKGSQCVFFDLHQYDDDVKDKITDQLSKEVEETLIALFGRNHFEALNKISSFILNKKEEEKINYSIEEFWRIKVKQYITDHLQNEDTLKDGYFFMFLPKTL